MDFWQYEFFERREREQQERFDAALTRINTLLSHPFVRHIIGQRETTFPLEKLLTLPGTAVLVSLSANLPADIKKFVGTILFSELLHAVRNRPEGERDHLSIYIDEFQNFSASEDIQDLITQGRKYGCAMTIAHQERMGQLSGNPKLAGATLAAVNKVFFQLTVADARELAAEFTQKVEPTEIRREAELIPSPHIIEDIWHNGYPAEDVMEIREQYFWLVDLLRTKPNEAYYVFDPQYKKASKHSKLPLPWGGFGDEEAYRSTPAMIKEGISLLNRHYYDCMVHGYEEEPITDEEVARMFRVIICFGGLFGWLPTMVASVNPVIGQKYINEQNKRVHAYNKWVDSDEYKSRAFYQIVEHGFKWPLPPLEKW